MASETTRPHDSVFKLVFGDMDNARGELRAVLPDALARRLDLDKLTLVPGSFVDPELRDSHSDLLFAAPLFGGGEALIYVLCEHRSTPDPLMPVRELMYSAEVWRRWLREHKGATRVPAIIPLVLHHGPKGWTTPTTMHEIIELDSDTLAVVAPYIPSFRLLIDDLWRVDDESLLGRAMTEISRLALLLLKHAGAEPELLGRLEGWLRTLGPAATAGRHLELLVGLMRYILITNMHVEPDALAQLVGRVAGEPAREAVVTAGQQLIEQGRDRGVVEGERRIILRQLEARFGSVSDVVRSRVDGGTAAELEAWAERLLTAASVDDVFGVN